ncbi:transcriptional regulator MraZ [Spirochaetia bacterium]|nr:transcriptional regulator MraZ [Spirochaetia bacterium]
MKKAGVSLPSRLRAALTNTLILTQGADDCLWLYPPKEWMQLVKVIMDSTSPFKANSRLVRRRIIGPSQEVEIDKAGRIAIPQSLREFAALSRDCVVLGQYEYVEIWDAARYRSYIEGNKAEFNSGFEELGALLQGEKDVSEKDGV